MSFAHWAESSEGHGVQFPSSRHLKSKTSKLVIAHLNVNSLSFPSSRSRLSPFCPPLSPGVGLRLTSVLVMRHRLNDSGKNSLSQWHLVAYLNSHSFLVPQKESGYCAQPLTAFLGFPCGWVCPWDWVLNQWKWKCGMALPRSLLKESWLSWEESPFWSFFLLPGR